MPAKMYKMGFVLLDNLSRCDSLRLPPDKIHFQMNCSERQPRLEDQEHAAVKEKAGADKTQNHGDDVISRVGKGHDTNSHAGSDKHSHTQIKATIDRCNMRARLVSLSSCSKMTVCLSL